MKKTTLLQKMIRDPEILVIPVVHDPLCARIAEQAGIKAVFSAGYSNSAAYLGRPDVSLMTLSEMVDCASRIVDAVQIPVFADGETGYGNVTNIIRTVELYEKAGVAGLFIEDQSFPKRCGHMDEKQVIPAEEMVAKIHAAVDARKDPDLVIMARTDAIAIHGIDEAISRANLYREAGADLLFVEAPRSIDQMRRICSEVKGPVFANNLPGGRSPYLSAQELQDLGYAVVADATSCTYVIAHAVRELFAELARTGSSAQMADRMILFDEFNRLVGLDDIRERERKYLSICG
ncbi:MAG TPA: isocitrate lyase/PEP mutase family protein [Methanoregulaceae archaeon]|nr:MAG: isocitrate lyase/PEP mutase family protein [Methanolinea sp.]HON82111.1 isocitrate lyase/PEP mutase family protein [Methanoregulaceae archaeon]HPD10809.1 isocitrate lyase/PEP mutase family protein [Methanoregulaceae archaeon]HRT15997.1 isocitrate lyase/PEP mutase family protein [Methanoregulaceae archaeon]HRU31462.1 isocitrate lyase/PEP mutase family protein [Methanoregulaceae archaeon]